MGSIRTVPPLNLKKMEEEGYNPTTYVLPDMDSVYALEELADLRKRNKEAFEKFDEQIVAFGTAPHNCQSTSTFETKLKVFNLIEKALPKMPGATLHFCGSSVNGCGSENCDVDLCWAIPVKPTIETDVKYPMFQQGQFEPEIYLRKALENITDIDGVTNTSLVHARVNIVKFDIEIDGLVFPCDININNLAGVYNTFMLRHYAKIDKRFPILARVLKAWGKKSQVVDSASGYLNSYTMVLMLLHFLQCGVSPPVLPNLNALCPDLFDGSLDLHKLNDSYDLDLNIQMPKNDIPIGDLLIGFFRYYGMFNYEHEGIILRLGCVAPKPNLRDWFFLEEVYDRYTVPKNLDARRLDYIKCTFLDTSMYLHRDPNFERLMNDERCFMKKF